MNESDESRELKFLEPLSNKRELFELKVAAWCKVGLKTSGT